MIIPKPLTVSSLFATSCSASYFGERRAVADIALRDSFKMAGRRGIPGNCNTYKFLEKCDRGSKCRFRHEVVARYV